MTKQSAAISIEDFHSRVAQGVRPRSAVSVQFRLAPMVDAETDTRAIPFVFSDDSIDSYNDRIDAKGWQFERSGAGTIALFGHDPSKIENIIGRAHNVRIEGNRLLGDIHFATKEENPSAEIVYQMVKGGYINSVSVGFEPLEWKQAKDPKRPGGLDFIRQRLREISVVGIPANENAIALARAAGIDVDRLELLAGAEPVTRDAPKVTKKGLYAVSALASLLAELGWLEESVEWEAEYEGDGSEIPARLTEAMNNLGQILVDMTIEEVSELLADDEADDGLVDIVLMEGKTEAQKAMLTLARMATRAKRTTVTLGLSSDLAASINAKVADLRARIDAVTRAGRIISAANETKLRDALASMTAACDNIQSMLDALDAGDTTERQATAEIEAVTVDAERQARLRDLEFMSVPQH